MLYNYMKIAGRNLLKHKVYSLINVLGLAIGMCCCLLILLYVKGELSYDRHHEHAAQIYRVAVDGRAPGRQLEVAQCPPALAPALRRQMPEVLPAARLWSGERLVSAEEVDFYEKRLFWADPELFDVFTFPLEEGDVAAALTAPNTAVLSRETARKYFGAAAPLGRTIRVAGEGDFEITGVLREIPDNAHFHFDLLLSSSSRKIDELPFQAYWIDASYFTYLRLQEGTELAQVEAKLGEIFETNVGEMLRVVGLELRFYLQALPDIHLYSQLYGELEPSGNIAYVYIFSAIAAFILLIACINFMNLATARSASRVREVGVRKVVGAMRGQLARQFLGESLVTCLLALVGALALIEVLLPFFNELADRNLHFAYAEYGFVALGVVGLVLIVGVLAGSYPAFFLSAFQPVQVLKGTLHAGRRGRHVRSALVVAQFAISIGLIVGTLVIGEQMRYLGAKNLGFDKENLVTMPIRTEAFRNSVEAFKKELLEHADILGAAASSDLPGLVQNKTIYWEKGRPLEESMMMSRLRVDRDFLKTMGIELLEGRNFRGDEEHATACLVNQAVARMLGDGSAVGKDIGQNAPPPEESHFYEVVGAVGDFHFEPLHAHIDPIVLHVGLDADFYHVTVRLRPGDPAAALAFMESKWKEFDGGGTFEYSFLDERLEQLYRAEEKLGKVFQVFAVLAVFVACLGLFGLASYTTEQRTKEIGVRKVLGASTPNIVSLLSKEFTRLVLLANAIAWPAAYWGLERWLRNFAYHTDLQVETFALGGALALAIAWLTVGHQAIRAALANPVEALRYE